MNDRHFAQIVDNYIKKFAVMNAPAPGSDETYKWRVAKQFRPMMDAALESDDSVFPSKLLETQKMVKNLTDSYTQPFYGLYEFAKKDPVAVKNMSRHLFDSCELPPEEKMEENRNFLSNASNLKEEHFPGSFRYESTIHTASVFQTLYDPDSSYIVKPKHARKFADCIDFFDDWKGGQSTRLDIYYRMCDEVAEAIQNNTALLETHQSRFELEQPGSLHPDEKHHLLVFDLIYCCSTYGLYSGVSFNRPPDLEKVRLREENEKKAAELYLKLEESKKEVALLTEGKAFFAPYFTEGATVKSKLNGDGIVQSCDESTVTVNFPAKEKSIKFKFTDAVSARFLYVDGPNMLKGWCVTVRH